MRKILIAALILPLSSVAFAQNQTGAGANAGTIREPGPARVTTPGTPQGAVVEPGGTDNSGPGSTGTVVRGATGADSSSNNSGITGNAGRPELPVGNTGGGGK